MPAQLLGHVPFPGAVLPHGLVVRLYRWVEITHGMTAFPADLVTELEAIHLADITDNIATVVRAARFGLRW